MKLANFWQNGCNTVSLQQINGNDFSSRSIPIPFSGSLLAADAVTNKIYLSAVPGVIVIDGATFTATETLTLAAGNPSQFAINSVTNRIYAAALAPSR